MKFVIGYASLLSHISIKRLFPNVGRIIPVEIQGHARCFNSYGTLSLNKGLASKADKNLAHASAILRPNSMLYALAFELDETDFRTYERHEFRYALRAVEAVSQETGELLSAIICYEGTDHDIDTSLIGVSDIYALYEQYGVISFWHTQHLPAEIYLKHCLASARALGERYVRNFLDTSFIYDRETSVRAFLTASGVDIDAYVAAAELSDVF
ncbi:MAG: hypothetical protein ABJN69_12315 [Hellea sp.]